MFSSRPRMCRIFLGYFHAAPSNSEWVGPVGSDVDFDFYSGFTPLSNVGRSKKKNLFLGIK